MTFLTLCLLENKAKKSAKNCRWHFHVCVATIFSQQLFRAAFIACRQCKSVRGFPAIYTSHDVNAPTGEPNSLRSQALAFSNCPITPIVSEWPCRDRTNEMCLVIILDLCGFQPQFHFITRNNISINNCSQLTRLALLSSCWLQKYF